MASIPTQTKLFPIGNRWGISDGANDVEFSPTRLVHAAVTAGHGLGWRRNIISDIGAQAELFWKSYALQSMIYERDSHRRSRQTPLLRFARTDRFEKMDPSERRALTYHLGITVAVAWARKILHIPWLLHLDLYQTQFNVNLQPGNSRPDLVGQHADGTWTVFEAKGRSSAPGPAAETKAKNQSQRVVDIGGVPPASCFAFFSYFGTDRQAIGRKKPSIVHIRIIDPAPSSDDENAIHLPLFTNEKFFECYYQPWFSLLRKMDQVSAIETSGVDSTKNLPPSKSSPMIWRELEGLDFRIGMLSEVAFAISRERYGAVPEIIQRVNAKEGLADQFPDWAGDGLIIEPGESWKKLWHERNKES